MLKWCNFTSKYEKKEEGLSYEWTSGCVTMDRVLVVVLRDGDKYYSQIYFSHLKEIVCMCVSSITLKWNPINITAVEVLFSKRFRIV